MNRTETKEYRFDETKHLHELLVDNKWKALTGCTTILSILAKPALISWSANMAVEYICEHISELISGTREEQDKILAEAKSAHRKKKEKAGDWGTERHAEIENYIKSGIKKDTIKPFIEWAENNKVKFLESEKHIYSKTHFLGGIVDIVCEIDGEKWIVDIKTGSGIYPEHFAQMAGYEIMLNEMGYPKIKGHIVLNLKKDCSFQEKRSISNEDAKNFFLACVQVYRLQEKFKNQIIK